MKIPAPRLILPLLLLSFPLSAQPGYEIAKMMDEREQPDDMVSDMTMILTSRTGATRTLTVHSVRKGDDKQIIWFLAPADDRGVAFLKIEYEDREDEMRMWLPSFKRMRRIASSKKGESFMGSDLSYEDMTLRALDEYTYELLGEEALDGDQVWILESTPKPELRSSYSRIVSRVRQSDFMPVREEYYDRVGNLLKVRTMDVGVVKEYSIPVRMLMQNVQKEHSTELIFDNMELDTGVKDDLFHERNLRRLP
ncbi:MAG: outer membrane lipoprotein-sorting protein [Fidelibacterota bacterium]|nr:MAG: outer membrane lipoprotein-sorting protein [Candidatus Neomarinimicrobiota bacterium]